jgi:hypothetical protein
MMSETRFTAIFFPDLRWNIANETLEGVCPDVPSQYSDAARI